VADTRRTRRGRPATTASPPTASGSRLIVESAVRGSPAEENGGTVLATTVSAEEGSAAERLHAYPEQPTTVAPGFRWLKHPAAMSPGWLEKPERIAALAMLTVVGLLVYSVIQRPVRRSLRTHDQQVPGHTGETGIPTAAVVWALWAPVAVVQRRLGHRDIEQVDGRQPPHLRVGDALGINHACYGPPSADNKGKRGHTP
jgi:hypothetical protein